jgi:hypothetical protein
MMGALAIIWSLLLCRNYKVYNDKKNSLSQVIRCTTLLRLWSSLQHMENRGLFTRCQHGWTTRQEILLSNIGGNIISKSNLNRPRSRYSFMSITCFELFYYFMYSYYGCRRAMCTVAMQRPCVMLKSFK